MTSVLIRLGVEPSTQTEITYFQFTVRIDEEITGLQISVYNMRRVHVFHTYVTRGGEKMTSRFGQVGRVAYLGESDTGNIGHVRWSSVAPT